MTPRRLLDIEFVPPDPAIIKLQPQIMLSVIGGLLRNAVENTPDHGKIVIKGENSLSGYRITIAPVLPGSIPAIVTLSS